MIYPHIITSLEPASVNRRYCDTLEKPYILVDFYDYCQHSFTWTIEGIFTHLRYTLDIITSLCLHISAI